jgi:hypothetical protein
MINLNIIKEISKAGDYFKKYYLTNIDYVSPKLNQKNIVYAPPPNYDVPLNFHIDRIKWFGECTSEDVRKYLIKYQKVTLYYDGRAFIKI